MPLQEIPFIGGAYEGYSKTVDAQRCINLYPEFDKRGGKIASLQPTPGLKVWKDYSVELGVRCLLSSDDYVWAVIGDTVYRIDSDKNSTTCTNTLDTTSGQVFMVENNSSDVMIVDISGGKGYYITGGTTTVTEITDVDFPTPSHLTYQDFYGIVTSKDTSYWYISGINDFSTWSTLKRTSTGALPDDARACISDKTETWIFGRKSMEAYTNTGNTDFAFERMNSVTQSVGISAAASLISIDNSIFWLDEWGNIRSMRGYTPTIISSQQIGYQISTYSTISDAIALGYIHEGKSFYIITFPSANSGKGVTWCYDIENQLWHQRSSYPNAPDGRWRAHTQAFFSNTNLFGDYEYGKIYEPDHTLYKDEDEILTAVRRGQAFDMSRIRFSVHSFELHIQSGVGIPTGQGSDPQIMLKYSKDYSKTWSNEKWRTMGKIGEYISRTIWRRMGRMRWFTPEVTITDPVNRVLVAAFANITPGKS